MLTRVTGYSTLSGESSRLPHMMNRSFTGFIETEIEFWGNINRPRRRDEAGDLSRSQYLFGIKVLFVSVPPLPVIVVGGVFESVIESTLMVFLVLVHVLNKRNDMFEI